MILSDPKIDVHAVKGERPCIAVYLQHYLTPSMTFIHRQLTGVMNRYDPIVLAGSVANLELFPFEQTYFKTRSPVSRYAGRVYRMLSGGSFACSSGQSAYWRKILKQQQVRLIHAHFGPSGVEIFPIAREFGIPLLVTFHGYDISSLLRNKGYVSDLGRMFQYAHTISVCQAFEPALLRMGARRDRQHVHHIGVPLEWFPFVHRVSLRSKVQHGDPVRLLQVSNILEKKGHRYTIMAFRELLQSYPQARLTIAGDGDLRGEVERQVRDLAITHAVEFTGRASTPQVADLMSQADIFVHHSVTGSDGNTEGIPTVIGEAMASGLIPVSTRHSGIPEIIEDGVNGYLVEEQDVRTYAERLKMLLTADESMGIRAAETIRSRFNLSTQNSKLCDIYEKVISET